MNVQDQRAMTDRRYWRIDRFYGPPITFQLECCASWYPSRGRITSVWRLERIQQLRVQGWRFCSSRGRPFCVLWLFLLIRHTPPSWLRPYYRYVKISLRDWGRNGNDRKVRTRRRSRYCQLWSIFHHLLARYWRQAFWISHGGTKVRDFPEDRILNLRRWPGGKEKRTWW